MVGPPPHGLLLRGALQTAVSVFVVVVGLRLRGADEVTAGAGELESLRAVALLLVIGAMATGLLGVARMVVGAIDLVPRTTVTGTVLCLDDRQALDFLPNALQHAIFTRNPQNIDKRRPRTEVVLDTADGVRQWTVRLVVTAPGRLRRQRRAHRPLIRPGARGGVSARFRRRPWPPPRHPGRRRREGP